MPLRATILFLAIPLAVRVIAQVREDADPQLLHGRVLGHNADGPRSPVAFASLQLREEGISVTSDAQGRFAVTAPSHYPATLVASATGFGPDSVVLHGTIEGEITLLLEAVTELHSTEVVAHQQATMLSTRTNLATEIIGRRELKRAACCDLSESFETNATVDASFSDAISGTKTIRMLGLDGKYAQIDVENIPFARGLSTNYGLTLIPGTWINSINVSKGIGTAVNGPNAMTGQIDLRLLDPATADRFFTNLYVNNQGRTELNISAAQHLGSASDNIVMMNGSLMQRDMDDNGDGFRDQPQTRRINLLDRWMQRKNRRTSQVIVRYVFDGRTGGQTDAHRIIEGPSGRHYIVRLDNEMADVIVKNGWILRDSTRSIGLLASFRNHMLSSAFGDRGYEGAQQSAYFNAVYQQLMNEGRDQIKIGGAFQFDDYRETYRDSAFGRTERVPGAFAEYTRTRGALTLVGGVRADLNNVYGTAFGPRLHLKYDIGPLTVARFSAGSAFRSANPIAENASALASSRNIAVQGPLGMERSWNFGLSMLHKFKWLEKRWSIGLDGYRTQFVSQVVSDMDRSPRTLAIYMLDGQSFANSLLGDIQVGLARVLDLKLSYRWYNVETTYDGVLRERPFAPKHRGLIDIAFTSRNAHWRADCTLNIFGTARLPSTAANPDGYRLPDRSPAYATLNAQITRVLGACEFYIGGENLTSAVQHAQIIAPRDPFGPYFDASMIWGPTNGTMIYGGMRFALERKTSSGE